MARPFLAVLAVMPWAAWGQPKATWVPEADRVLASVFAAVEAEQAKFTEPAQPANSTWVRRKLQHMENVDQAVRAGLSRPELAVWGPEARRFYNEKLLARMGRIDRANTAELKDLLKVYRWFTITEFGGEADNSAWLLVQHADHDVEFQKQVLEILAELYPKGETSPSHYAYLWDRVAVHTGRKQRYGTQGRCTGPGTWEPDEVEDPVNLEARRAAVKLEPMREYKHGFRERGLCP